MGCVFVIEVWLVSEKNKIFSAWGSWGVGGENSHRLLLEINGFISNPNDYQPINCCWHHPVIKLASSHVCIFRRTREVPLEWLWRLLIQPMNRILIDLTMKVYNGMGVGVGTFCLKHGQVHLGASQ